MDSQKLLFQILLMKFISEILFSSLIVNLAINIEIEIGKTFSINKTNSIFIYFIFFEEEKVCKMELYLFFSINLFFIFEKFKVLFFYFNL